MTLLSINQGFWLNLLAITNLGGNPDQIQVSQQFSEQKICPTNIETLTDQLLKDLPSYSNRVIQRSRLLPQEIDTFSYILLAGRPEFEPLKIESNQYDPVFEETTEQIFFTTLERRYFQGKLNQVQSYHWLFLTQTTTGWKLVMLFSQLGSGLENQPPLPPQETSFGVIGQGVKLWLRDCEAGAIQIIRKKGN
jgi:hypothetical protein